MHFYYKSPKNRERPIIFSSPHSGTLIPSVIKSQIIAGTPLIDTDFDVDKLYDFVPSLGCHLLSAKYSRYVVDLNRSIQNTKLYHDGRITTDIVPLTTFQGYPLYENPVSTDDRIYRIENFYYPYHNKLQDIVSHFKKNYKRSLIFECHSISRNVNRIQTEDFPDFILGTDNGKSLPQKLVNVVYQKLKSYEYSVSIDAPFSGGHITRSYYDDRVHTFQIEMSKDIYLDTNTNMICHRKSKNVKSHLSEITQLLIEGITNLD